MNENDEVLRLIINSIRNDIVGYDCDKEIAPSHTTFQWQEI